MRLKNPLTFSFAHGNFNNQTLDMSLNQDADVSGFLNLDGKAPDGRTGRVNVQPQDNGNVVLRIHLNGDGSSVFHVLVVGDQGQTLFEG